MVLAVIAFIVLLILVVSRPPGGTGGSATMDIQEYVFALDRRQKQLSQGRLEKW